MYFRHIIYILVLAIFLAVGCSLPDLDNLGLPTWTISLQTYVLNDMWPIEELANESDLFISQEDILIINHKEYETIDFDFYTDQVIDQDIIEIGDIVINDPPPKLVSDQLISIAPKLEPFDDQLLVIDPFNLQEVDLELEPFDEFEIVHIAEGELLAEVENNTVIWLGNSRNNEPFIIELISSYTHEILHRIEFENDIAPHGGVEEEITNISGLIFHDKIYARISGGSRGSDGDEVHLDVYDEINISIDFEDVSAKYTRAVIPEQTIEDKFEIDLAENILIYKAFVVDEDKYLFFEVSNNVDIDIDITLLIEDIKLPESESSSYFEQDFIIPANSKVFEKVNIRKAIIGDGEPTPVLNAYINGYTLDTGDEVREIYSSDTIIFDLTVEELNFSYVRGILKPQEEKTITGSTDFDIDFPDFYGDFSLKGYSELKMDFELPIPAQLELNMFSHGVNGEKVPLETFADQQRPNFTLTQGKSTFLINSDEYNINDLFSVMPDSITYVVNAVFGHETKVFEYHAGDYANVDMEIFAETDIQADCWFAPQYDNEPETSIISSEDFDQDIYDAYTKAYLELEYKNTTGLQFGVNILFSELELLEFDQVYYPDTNYVSIIDIPMLRQTNNYDTKILSIEIEQSSLKSFLADSVFVIPKFYLVSESGHPLSGFIEILASINIEAEFNNSLIDSEDN